MSKIRIISLLLIVATLLLLFCSCSANQGEQEAPGKDGANGENGTNGVDGADRTDGIGGTNGVNGKDGKDGRTPEYRAKNGWVQWKYTDESDEEWRNLYEYALDLFDPSEPIPDGIPAVTISTKSTTDNYGLAGSYTMIYEKEFAVGSTIKLTATVNEGYNFEGWYVGNVCLSKELNYCYTVQNEDITIDAKYSYYTITTASDSNTANVAGKYTILYEQKISVGEAVELSATVNDGYNFEGWYINDVCVSRNLNYTYEMEAKNVIINAEYSSYQLTVIGAAYNTSGQKENYFNAGTYTSYSNKNISAGKTITLTATVKDGYNFGGWYVNGTCVSSELTYTFDMEKENLNVEATYFYYTLSTTAKYHDTSYIGMQVYDKFETPNLYISIVCEGEKISVGKEITVIATDIEGYTFTCWRTNDSILSTDKTYTLTMPANDVSIYALYSPE